MEKFFEVGTFHATVLLASTSTGHVVAGPKGLERTVPVIACLMGTNRRFAYLDADLPSGVSPRLLPLSAVGRIIPVGVTAETIDGSVAFFSPWTGKFVVAAPVDPESNAGHAVFDAQRPQDYEKLYLNGVADDEVPPYLLAAEPLLQILSELYPSSEAIEKFLANAPPGPLTGDVLNAASLLLSRQELADLSMKISRSEILLDHLSSHYPDDLFAQHALGPLVQWLFGSTNAEPRPEPRRTFKSEDWFKKLLHKKSAFLSVSKEAERTKEARYSPNIKEIGLEFDALDTVGLGGLFVSLPFACNVSIRRNVASRRRTCVIATARNEGLYLLEWLAHHRAMGFEAFFIYSNGNTDGSDRLLQALAEAGEITWIKSIVRPGVRPQWKAYNHALQVDPSVLDYDWALVIDLDEYFQLDRDHFSSVQAYLDWAERVVVDWIAFNWLVIGSNGETHWRDDLLRNRFPSTRANQDEGNFASAFVKSMFRPNKFPVSMPHHPVPFWDENVVVRAPSMEPFSYDPREGPGKSITPDMRIAWIAHYFFKSNEEFVYKFSRPRGDDRDAPDCEFAALTPEFIRGFVSASVGPAARASSARQVAVDAAADIWLNRLLDIPRVKDASLSVKHFYSARLENLLGSLIASRAIAEAGDAGQAFVAPLVSKLGSSNF